MPVFTPLVRARRAGRNSFVRNDLRVRLSLNSLEDRVQPSATTIDLGAASHFGVLGLQRTIIDFENSAVGGNVGVSQRGVIWNGNHSAIAGNVDEFSGLQYWGPGKLGGAVVNDAGTMSQADSDALQASSAAAALAPTQTFRRIERATTITGSGGLNVINVGGDITASLTLNGTANDVFIVNVRGDLNLNGKEGLNLAGGVTADHVLYNFVGRDGRINANGKGVINGTILAPNHDVVLQGTQVNGEVVGGDTFIAFSQGVQVNPIAFSSNTTNATNGSLSGSALVVGQGNGYANIQVTLTGVDNQGNKVNLTTQTASDGTYTFTNLAAGTYTLTFGPALVGPAVTGTASVGSVSGNADGIVSADGSTVNSIVLTGNSLGVNYNYAVNTAAS